MKKLFGLILAVCLLCGNACATILEPKGVDLAFKLSSGVEAVESVVLCRSLSAHLDYDATSRKMKTLSMGDTFLTWSTEGEWQNCYYAEGKDPVWVRSYYVVDDPSYYLTDGQTPVYAYDDLNAPRVALLGRNEELPIIMETDRWCVVSLRGASGWIRKTSKDQIPQSRFDTDCLYSIVQAELNWHGGYSVITDAHVLAQLSALLTNSHSMGGTTSGCPFGRYLTLTLEDGEQVILELASDSCGIFRVYGRDYRYGLSSHSPNQQLLNLFPDHP